MLDGTYLEGGEVTNVIILSLIFWQKLDFYFKMKKVHKLTDNNPFVWRETEV